MKSFLIFVTLFPALSSAIDLKPCVLKATMRSEYCLTPKDFQTALQMHPYEQNNEIKTMSAHDGGDEDGLDQFDDELDEDDEMSERGQEDYSNWTPSESVQVVMNGEEAAVPHGTACLLDQEAEKEDLFKCRDGAWYLVKPPRRHERSPDDPDLLRSQSLESSRQLNRKRRWLIWGWWFWWWPRRCYWRCSGGWWWRRCRWVCVSVNRSPTIYCPYISSVYAGPSSYYAFHSWNSATASDPEDGTLGVHQTLGPRSHSYIREGFHTVKYEAWDRHRKTVSCYRNFHVYVRRCPDNDWTSDPQHGRVQCSSRNIYGSTCSYTCNSGYELDGRSSVECLYSQHWNADKPTCKKTRCTDPPVVTRGRWEGCDDPVQGSECTLVCDQGYSVREGDSSTICVSAAVWSAHGICQDVTEPSFTCPSVAPLYSAPKEKPIAVSWVTPTVTDNSGETINVDSDYTSGHLFSKGETKVVFTAEDSAGNVARCEMTVTVLVKRCGSHPVLEHGTVANCTYGRSVGSVCDLSCHNGFDLMGVTERECLDTQEWSNALPVCERVDCGTTPSVVDGSLTCSNGTVYESVCVLHCLAGYSVVGHGTTVCTAAATWSAIGTCQDTEAPKFLIGCPTENAAAAALGYPTIVSYNLPQVTDNSQDSVAVTGTPSPGSEFPLGTSEVDVTATDEAGNTASCTLILVVTRGECVSPKNTDLGSGEDNLLEFDCPDGHVYGAECQLSCSDNNPVQEGPTVIKCERDGDQYNWFYGNSKPICKAKECDVIEAPTYGSTACSTVGNREICSLSCNDQYAYPKVSGQDDGVFYCDPNGYWVPMVIRSDVCKRGRFAPNAVMESEMYYYSGACRESYTEIKEHFVELINDTSIIQGLCGTNGVVCDIGAVRVTCGSRGKRSVGEISYNFVIKIKFEVKIFPFDPANTTRAEIEDVADKINEEYFINSVDGKYNLPADTSTTTDSYSYGAGIVRYNCPEFTFPRPISSKYPVCLGCDAGYIYSESLGYCDICPLGTYQPQADGLTCLHCPDNKTTRFPGSTNISDCIDLCPSGSYSSNGRQPDCDLCSVGTYQAGTGKAGCDECPFGTSTEQKGATSKSDCQYFDMVFTSKTTIWPMFPATSDFTSMAYICRPSDLVDTVTEFSLRSNEVEVASLGCDKVVVYISQRAATGADRKRKKCYHVAMTMIQGVQRLYVDGINVETDLSSKKCTSLKVKFTPSNDIPELRLSTLQMSQDALNDTQVADYASACDRRLEDNILSTDKPLHSLTTMSSCDAENNCTDSPCSNHSICIDRLEGFDCECDDLWSGTLCEIPPDFCEDHECANGATCLNHLEQGIYTCQCSQDFRGTLCLEEIVHGEWSLWEEWSPCTVTCGVGSRNRARTCDNPAPDPDGRDCEGLETEVDTNCNPQPCPIDGVFGQWTGWTCSATCGNSTGERRRDCDSPRPQHGGRNCTGLTVEVKVCQDDPCPVHGNYTAWSEWQECSQTCGTGFTNRDRNCSNPEPEYGGMNCIEQGLGPATEEAQCNTQECPTCPPLMRNTGQSISCRTNDTNGMMNCTVTCTQTGYMISDSYTYFQCGILTNYTWEPLRRPPRCSKSESPEKRTFSVSGSMDGVKDSEAVGNAILDSAQSVVSGSSDGSTVTVQTSPGGGRRKRDTATTFTVSITVDSPSAGTDLSTASDSELDSQRASLDTFENASQALARNLQQVFNVTVDNQRYTVDTDTISDSVNINCHVGLELSDGLCVECGPGTMWQDESCVVCPLNHYQDGFRQTSCLPCPDGHATTDIASQSLEECLPHLKRTDSGSDTNIAIPVIAVVLVSGLIFVIVIIIIVKCFKNSKASAVGSQSLAREETNLTSFPPPYELCFSPPCTPGPSSIYPRRLSVRTTKSIDLVGNFQEPEDRKKSSDLTPVSSSIA